MSTVEEFERKMDMLAETNGVSPGRWVLVPRKGERFMGSRDRTRARIRRRRRQVFAFLVEATGLTLLIGLFPPLRLMLVGTVILSVLLLLYVVLLIQLRASEAARIRVARARHAMVPPRRQRVHAFRGVSTRAPVGSNGNGNGHSNGNGHGGATGNGHSNGHPNGNSHSNGNGHSGSAFDLADTEDFLDAGVRILDDVHVIVRRRGEADAPLQVAVQ